MFLLKKSVRCYSGRSKCSETGATLVRLKWPWRDRRKTGEARVTLAKRLPPLSGVTKNGENKSFRNTFYCISKIIIPYLIFLFRLFGYIAESSTVLYLNFRGPDVGTLKVFFRRLRFLICLEPDEGETTKISVLQR